MKPAISSAEHKTYDLFQEFFDDRKWSSELQVIANIFNAYHTAAFTGEQLEKIACALYGYRSIDIYQSISLSKAVRQLVAAKVLRSRSNKGNRLYEVNY